MTRRVYKLVEDTLSSDTVEALTVLLERAKRGELQGVAYVAMYRGRQYTAGVTGECRRNPTFTRGMVAGLDDELGRLVHAPAPRQGA